ncbi:MAG: thermosome subunit alpha [Methanofollis liminatans]|uniref:Thermosome n=1 Tax=Methanofollis liminatans DSM 4140 TaxID=28892 RepID=J0S2Y6_9EURY|nr:thermosome subunit alpha [Methanofollis liminatans]EJG08286.1 thermosome [Methanofollis liminatans DSM 4140]MDD3112053.1 thermosome subunit alpha [Methanofollis liminatans]
MSQQLGGQPILILKEGSSRTRGRDAQSINIAAAKAVAAAVRTTLGPKGMDKMLVDTIGDVVITNDGVTILKEMDIEHPAAKMMVEVAKTQDDEVGDGTTTSVVVAGELLKRAEDLLEQDVHPTVIAHGYRMAADKAIEIVKDLAIDVKPNDADILLKIAGTAMTGKGAEASKDKLCDLIVRAVTMVAEEDGTVDLDFIKVEKKVGGSIEDSGIVEGVLIDKERVHPAMPKKVDNAKILLLNAAVEFKKTEVDAEINITSPDQLQMFLDEEERMIRGIVDKIIASGANVLFCQKGIDDIAQHYLAKAGIFATRRVKKSDMEKLSRATGATLISSIDAISPEELGFAGIVEERKVSGEDMTFVEQCKNPKAVSIIIKGGTEHVVDELDRAIEDALRVVEVALRDKKFVAGGGSPEVELSLRLREYAATVGGRAQLAIEAFASALEIIPRTLAENAGLDPIDILVDLRAAHEKGQKTAGLDVNTGKAGDMLAQGVVEPLRVKTQAISSAAEAAVMILRIDDVIASSKSAGPSPEEMAAMGGGMGGMGMPPM